MLIVLVTATRQAVSVIDKKLSYRRVTARCVLSVVILGLPFSTKPNETERNLTKPNETERLLSSNVLQKCKEKTYIFFGM